MSFPARISSATRIADNKLAELSDWNEDALRIEFGALMDLSLAGELEFDLDIRGFEIPEIDIIIDGASEAAAEAAETVEPPTLPNQKPIGAEFSGFSVTTDCFAATLVSMNAMSRFSKAKTAE